MVIVDADIFIDVLRRNGPALEWIAKAVAENEVILPGYVVMELIQGRRNREEQEKMMRTIEAYRVYPMTGFFPPCRNSARPWSSLPSRGRERR